MAKRAARAAERGRTNDPTGEPAARPADAGKRSDLPQGSLDLLVLQALDGGQKHGYQIARHIHSASDEALRVEEGSLYPALHRMERRGWIEAEWGVSESNRRAKYYRLTRSGRDQLQTEVDGWREMVIAIGKVIDAGAGPALPGGVAPRPLGEGSARWSPRWAQPWSPPGWFQQSGSRPPGVAAEGA
ncbi:MAG: PadR family transcriptional regulator [Planctomycetota bacterium]